MRYGGVNRHEGDRRSRYASRSSNFKMHPDVADASVTSFFKIRVGPLSNKLSALGIDLVHHVILALRGVILGVEGLRSLLLQGRV